MQSCVNIARRSSWFSRMRIKNRHYLALLLLVLITASLFFFLYGDDGDDRAWDGQRALRFDLIAREPRRRVTYAYPVSGNYTPSEGTVDLARSVPDGKELDNRMVVVTGFGQQLAYTGLGMIASVQAHMPLKRVVVYDLGVHPKLVRMMKQMCNVEVRSFDFEKYPIHVRKTANKAWRVFALLDVLNDYGALYYVDPHMRFRAPINLLFPFVVSHRGLIGRPDRHNTTLATSHPALFPLLGLHRDDFQKRLRDAPSVAPDMLLAVNSSDLRGRFWRPLAACAARPDCLAPPGAADEGAAVASSEGRTHAHRYDFAAITLLMYREFGVEWSGDAKLNAALDKTQDYVEPGGVHDYIWAHYCNPPKSEIDCRIQRNHC